MSRIAIVSLVAAIAVAVALAATALAGSGGSMSTTVSKGGYTPAALEALGKRWEAYAAYYAGPLRKTAVAQSSGYTPAALRALGARWTAYAKWYHAHR